MWLWQWVAEKVRLLVGRRQSEALSALVVPECVPEVLPPLPVAAISKPAKSAAGKGMRIAENGEFYFRDEILSQLDLYRWYAARLKKSDAEAYGLYSKVGAVLIAGLSLNERDDPSLEPWFVQNMPTFGAAAMIHPLIEDMETKESKEGVFPKFLYFHKYTRSPKGVQITNNTVYLCTYYFDGKTNGRKDRRALKNHGYPAQFAVSVSPDGDVRVLMSLVTEHQVVKHGRGGAFSIAHQRWGIPEFLRVWAIEQKMTPAAFLRRAFIVAVNKWVTASMSTIRVSAEKGGVVAAFGVDMHRTPYFFADREVSVTSSGKKRRIFHVRRTHFRMLANGKRIPIKMHFAGLRDFFWNGYRVHITVPGWHHHDLREWNVGVLDEQTVLPTEGPFVDIEEMAGRFAAEQAR